VNIPNPGSDEAIEMGCWCPVIDNGHGNGYMGMKTVFKFNANYSLHGNSPARRKLE
jgi:hypothetical protein